MSFLRDTPSVTGSLTNSILTSDNSNSSHSSAESWLQSAVSKNSFTAYLINARSLKDKLPSLRASMDEMAVDVCLITETWFKNEEKEKINDLLEDFKNNYGYSFLRRDRTINKRGGGVAICFNQGRIQLAKAKIPPSKHEVFAAIGRRTGQRRKVAIVVLYVPPWYNAQQNRSLYNYVNDVILTIKNNYENPMILLGGDLNRRDHTQMTRDYPEITSIRTGPTREDSVLDIFMSNFNEMIVDKGTLEPIESTEMVSTDHRTVFVKYRMPRVPTYTTQKYSYFHLTDPGIEAFGNWLEAKDWRKLRDCESPSGKVEELQASLEEGMNKCFIKKQRTKKSSEPVWMTDWLRDMIEDRRKVFRTDQGRSTRWKDFKKVISGIVRKRRRKFDAHVLLKFETDTNPGNFFKHIDGLLGANSRPRWSPMSLYPDLEPKQVAERLAEYFNSISSEYSPLNFNNVPKTYDRRLPLISEEEVVKRIRSVKKPNSTVPGDIPPVLVSRFPHLLASPIADIFNKITTTKEWPERWKIEYVTIIPKNSDPDDPSQCRNISCTNFMSKLYESFVLQWSREEVTPKLNQYGGEKKSSATHLLIEVMDDVTAAMEDNRLGVVLSAIDFSKAFNRLEHEHCLRSFAKKGASNDIMALLGSFLSGRVMTVKVEDKLSDPRPVNAGAPQGSVLGCYLFNIGVDDLEEGYGTEAADGSVQEEAHQETLCRSDDFPISSTPKRVRNTDNIPFSPVQPATRPQEINILPRVANVPPWLLKAKDPKVKHSPIKSYKFVDDGINTATVNMRQARLLVEEGNFFKEIVDKRTEGLLTHVAANAERKGMKINAKKTSLMVVSASTSFDSRVRISVQDQTITGSESMKILGVTLDRDCSFKNHVELLRGKLRRRTWALSRLRRRGLPEDKLVRAYSALIRPVVEYASPAWSSMLTAEQSERLERQQTQALKNIYGAGLSAQKMRLKADIPTLKTRRDKAGLSFIKRCINNERCTAWFSERNAHLHSRRRNVCYPRYYERTARTDRFRNSPKNYLIRQLNSVV